MRCVQKIGTKGSLKWMQMAVNEQPDVLARALAPHVDGADRIDWRSPRKDDDYAEYRDGLFLERIGCGDLAGELAGFWPKRGPQWDALGLTGSGDILLVEAKAHIPELKSACAAEDERSLKMINAALKRTAEAVGARSDADWTKPYFQFANRLAHLNWLREHGRPAWLVMLGWVGDAEVRGPASAHEWGVAHADMRRAMGLPEDFAMNRYILHVDIHVKELARDAATAR